VDADHLIVITSRRSAPMRSRHGADVAIGVATLLGSLLLSCQPGNSSEFIERQKLVASNGAERDEFGTSVSVSGDVAVIGAYLGDRSGSAYVFVRGTDGRWSEQQMLAASDGDEKDHFGMSVSVSRGVVLIGAVRGDNKGRNTGTAYVFSAARDGIVAPP